MPTRSQGAAAAAAKMTPGEVGSSNPQTQFGSASETISQSSPSTLLTSSATDPNQILGHRLRKRRIAESSLNEDNSLPPPKRTLPTKKITPAAKQVHVQTSGQDTPYSVRRDDLEANLGSTNILEGGPNAALSSEIPFINMEENTPAPEPIDSQYEPDYNPEIQDIMDYGETVDNPYVPRVYDAIGVLENGDLGHSGASHTLKLQSLPVLDNLATQILQVMARATYHEILTIAMKPDTDPGQAYANLKSLFDHTKKVYSAQEPFLNPFELRLPEKQQMDIIRKANMATFVSSVFGSQDVGFYHLNENFLDTFIADGGRLLKSQAQLFLDLKTQAYISAVQNTDRNGVDILADLFPDDLDARLLKRRPGAKQLAPSENEFVQRARNRKKALLDELSNQATLKQLPEKYVWEDFLRDISTYVSKNSDVIAGVAIHKPSHPTRPPNIAASTQQDQPAEQTSHDQEISPPQLSQQHALRYPNRPPHPQQSTRSYGQNDLAEKAAQAAHYAVQDFGNGQGPGPPQQSLQEDRPSTIAPTPRPPPHQMQQKPPEIQYHFEHPLHPDVPAPPPPFFQQNPYQFSQQRQDWNETQPNPSFNDQQVIPYPTQSAPTQVLYERARNAATARTTPSNRRASHPSQRRAWTTEEESALMAGLDRVKGPHWSQILNMFGPGGTINEILKDRNQVQLKDKARNLKLFFLKSSTEVPYYLQFVTGELKTRAPAQAARNEAKEKRATEEDRAHVEGLMALAGGSSQGVDQALASAGNQNSVPVANMGLGSQLPTNGESTMDLPIDPEMVATQAKQYGLNADAPMDGIAEIMVPNSQLVQQPLMNGTANVRQVNVSS